MEFDYQTFKSTSTFWLWFSFKIRSKICPQYLQTWLPPMFKATTSYNLHRTDIHCLLCPSLLSCFFFYRERWCFGTIYRLWFKQRGLPHCSKKLSKTFFSLILSPPSPENIITLWLSVFFISSSSSQFPAIFSHPHRFPSSTFPLYFLHATNVTGA